jgi:Fic family protein
METPPKITIDATVFDLMRTMQQSGAMNAMDSDYLYWDKIKYKKTPHDPILLWSAIKIHRLQTAQFIEFGGIKFSYATNHYIHEMLHFFDMNIGGRLGAKSTPSPHEKDTYMLSGIFEEAIASSQMEGATTTRIQAEEMLQKERKPQNKSEQMIMNNYLGVEHIVHHKNDDLTPETLLNLHRIMTTKTMKNEKKAGFFRENNDIYVVNHQNSEVVHTPPDHQELMKWIEDLCYFFNNDTRNFIHPIVKAIVIHFMLGYIHPFIDANGRTARALFYWFLLKKGYWLTEYLSISAVIKDTKVQYEKAYIYAEKDDNDLTYFVNYNLKVMRKSFEKLQHYIAQKQAEVRQAAQFLRIAGINDRQAQILNLLHDEPNRMLNHKEIENRFGVSGFTARADLKGLVVLGFLDKILVNKIKQNFVRAANFDELIKNTQKLR